LFVTGWVSYFAFGCSSVVGSPATSTINCPERLVSEIMTYRITCRAGRLYKLHGCRAKRAITSSRSDLVSSPPLYIAQREVIVYCCTYGMQPVSHHAGDLTHNIIGHFGDEYFQAIDCAGTDNQTQQPTRLIKHKLTNRILALVQRTQKTQKKLG